MISNARPASLSTQLKLSLGLCILLLASSAYCAPLYKWVDEDGSIRYSDNLPSSQTQKRFQTLSPEGRLLSTKEAPKSPAELQRERDEKKRIEDEARIKAEVEARLVAAQEHHDNVLLMTFTDEKEIIEAQNERLAVIDSVIQLLGKNITTEQEKLQREERIAKQTYTDKNIEIPGGQAQKIEYFTEKLLSKQQSLDLKLQERDRVKQQYTTDLIRYRELIRLRSEAEAE